MQWRTISKRGQEGKAIPTWGELPLSYQRRPIIGRRFPVLLVLRVGDRSAIKGSPCTRASPVQLEPFVFHLKSQPGLAVVQTHAVLGPGYVNQPIRKLPYNGKSGPSDSQDHMETKLEWKYGMAR